MTGCGSERLQTGPARKRSRARIPNGARNFKRHCRTCERRISPAQVLASKITPCIATWRRPRGSRIWTAAAKTRTEADARLCPQPHGPGSSVDRRAPEYFIHGSESDLARSPQNYCRVQTKNRRLVIATAETRTLRAGRHAAAQLRQPGVAGRR